eukprot:COSAG02_NODE_4925_length_4831_cov_2.178149_8_plen_69_part_00
MESTTHFDSIHVGGTPSFTSLVTSGMANAGDALSAVSMVFPDRRVLTVGLSRIPRQVAPVACSAIAMA